MQSLPFPVVAKTAQQLDDQTQPQHVTGGNLEAVATMFYDTQTYVAAGSTELNYFTVTSPDQTISNMAAAGQFPDPQFFEIYYFTCDVIIDSARFSGVPSVWRDVNTIMLAARPTFTFSLSDKPYGTVPLSLLQAAGGITGEGYSQASVTVTSTEFARNGYGGAWGVDGSITISPKTNFRVTLRWGVPLQAVNADTLIRIGMVGNWHRRIL